MLVGYLLIVGGALHSGAANYEIVFCVNLWPSKMRLCVRLFALSVAWARLDRAAGQPRWNRLASPTMHSVLDLR